MLNIFELQKELVAAALPSGLESRQADVIKKYAVNYCDELYTDSVGNLVCHKRGPGKKLMLAAHMDVIGFMANFIDERGFVRFVPVGGISPALTIGYPVVFENGVYGCVLHDEKAQPGSTALSKVEMHNMYIDIGARNKAEAERLISVGMCATFCAEPVQIAGGNIMT
ncbi:MAG: M42 family peptidase, partial [Clostridia bacterium]|nr:M42 family peptidase [Clostridia bacterium]